jgi:hypothetical protein
MLKLPLVMVAVLALTGTVTRLKEKVPATAVALNEVMVTDPLPPKVAPALKNCVLPMFKLALFPEGPRVNVPGPLAVMAKLMSWKLVALFWLTSVPPNATMPLVDEAARRQVAVKDDPLIVAVIDPENDPVPQLWTMLELLGPVVLLQATDDRNTATHNPASRRIGGPSGVNERSG